MNSHRRHKIYVTKGVPTTREALFFPSSLAAFRPWGIADAAIFVMLMELVFVARIASGLSSATNEANIDCLRGRDSETAYSFCSWSYRLYLGVYWATNLNDHIDVPQPLDTNF